MLLHRFAATVAVVCFVLLLVGGLVHNTNSGLACGTDWPRCHGVWLPKMEGNVLVEHGHRLLAGAVGVLTLVLTIALAVRARRRGGQAGLWLGLSTVGFVLAQLAGIFVFMSRGHGPASSHVPFLFFTLGGVGLLTMGLATAMAFRERGSDDAASLGLALTAVGLVVAQGLLGALTVQLGLSPAMSTAHLGTSMLFFLVLVALAVRTRPVPQAAHVAHVEDHRAAQPVLIPERARSLVLATLALVYAQMILGAAMRHLGAGMICGDEFPLCHGLLWPTGAHYAVYLHIFHRIFGCLALVMVILVAAAIRRATRDHALGLLALSLPVLATVQVALGIWSVWSFLGVVQVTAHLGVAATMLAVLLGIALLSRSQAAGAVGRAEDLVAPTADLAGQRGAS